MGSSSSEVTANQKQVFSVTTHISLFLEASCFKSENEGKSEGNGFAHEQLTPERAYICSTRGKYFHHFGHYGIIYDVWTKWNIYVDYYAAGAVHGEKTEL